MLNYTFNVQCTTVRNSDGQAFPWKMASYIWLKKTAMKCWNTGFEATTLKSRMYICTAYGKSNSKPSDHDVITKRSPRAKRSPRGHQVVTKWSPSGQQVNPLKRSGLGAFTVSSRQLLASERVLSSITFNNYDLWGSLEISSTVMRENPGPVDGAGTQGKKGPGQPSTEGISTAVRKSGR